MSFVFVNMWLLGAVVTHSVIGAAGHVVGSAEQQSFIFLFDS